MLARRAGSRTASRRTASPLAARACSSSKALSKWSSMARLWRPVTIRTSSSPAAAASSTTYWMAGLSTTGSISFGVALVAGRKRVPSPATGTTALVTGAVKVRSLAMAPDPNGPGCLAAAIASARHVRAVAALTLGHVEGLGGRPQQGRRRRAVHREGGTADRQGDVERRLALLAERLPAYGDTDPLGQLRGTLDGGLREDHDDLLAAVAGEGVDLADLLLHPPGQLTQHAVAAGVPVL